MFKHYQYQFKQLNIISKALYYLFHLRTASILFLMLLLITGARYVSGYELINNFKYIYLVVSYGIGFYFMGGCLVLFIEHLKPQLLFKKGL